MLVDTSVWIDHLRRGNASLARVTAEPPADDGLAVITSNVEAAVSAPIRGVDNRRTREMVLNGRAAIGLPVIAAVFLVAPSDLQAQQEAPHLVSSLSITTTLQDGREYVYQRGTVDVPQNRRSNGGGVFHLEFYRFPALPSANPDTPPIFRLTGGPGFRGFGNALEDPNTLEFVMGGTKLADVIYVGQRGIGSSGPDTACDRVPLPVADTMPSRREIGALAFQAALDCRAKWDSAGIDLSGINLIEAAHDVADVAAVLGYESIQIQGGSFGSQWGIAILTYHPELVERALLSGLEGPDHTYDLPSDAHATLQRIAADAESSPLFRGELARGELLATFRATIDRVAESEPTIRAVHPNGDTVFITVSADEIRELWPGWSRPENRNPRAAWPADIIALSRPGGIAPLGDRILRNRLRYLALSTAAFFMFDCSSGISDARRVRSEDASSREVVGDLGYGYDLLCPAWEADLGPEFRAGRRIETPTVMVHGDWDLFTPLENALALQPYFVNHRLVIVERGAHASAAIAQARQASPEFAAAVERFIVSGDMSAFPDRVTLPPVDWVPIDGN